MIETMLKSLWSRKQQGVKVKELAAEAGVSPQKLVAEFRRLGQTEAVAEFAEPIEPAVAVAIPAEPGVVAEPVAVAEPAPVVAEPVIEQPAPEPIVEPVAAEPVAEPRVETVAVVESEAVQPTTPSAPVVEYPPSFARPELDGPTWIKLREGEADRWVTRRQVAALLWMAEGGIGLPSDVGKQLRRKGLIEGLSGGIVLSEKGRAWLALVPSPSPAA